MVLTCLADNDLAQQPKRFAVAGGYVDVVESFDEGIEFSVYSNTLWDGALMASGLLRRQPWLVRGRRVLELGAGLGLPSLVAGALGARVVASEQAPLTLLKREVARNLPAVRRAGGCVDVRELDWEWPADRVVAEVGGPFDVVLGCDVLAGVKHGTKHYRQMLRLVSVLLHETGSALFTWVPRCGNDLRLLQRCVDEELPGWEATPLDHTLYDAAFVGDGCSVVHVQRGGCAVDLNGLD